MPTKLKRALRLGLHPPSVRRAAAPSSPAAQLKPLETLVNMAFKRLPTLYTAATITRAMPAAIIEYSMAVAPDSSAANRAILPLTIWPSRINLATCRDYWA